MPRYKVAHIREQGQDIIIIPLNRTFGHKTRKEQNDICSTLQDCATSAGLAGTVVPVWNAVGGRIGFLAPKPWHQFFKSITLAHVKANINRELICK